MNVPRVKPVWLLRQLLLGQETRTKLRCNRFLLILLGLAVYFLLPQFAKIEHAFQVVSTLKIPLVTLSLGAHALSYLGSGLLRAVVKLAAKPVTAVDRALLKARANSVGTLGGSQAPPQSIRPSRDLKLLSASYSKDGMHCCKAAGMVQPWVRCSISASTC
jgi:hypothetical protein